MFRSKLPWTIALASFFLFLLFVSGIGKEKKQSYSISKAQYYLQTNNWDSAKVHAVHVLAEEAAVDSITLARTIISLANENIESALIARAELKKSAYEKLSARYDKQDKILWYRDVSSPGFESIPAFYLYLGKREDKLWMRLRVQYSGTEYLFLNQFLVDTDSGGYTFTPKEQVQRNHGEKMVWEWMDEAFTPDMYNMFYDIAHSEKAVIRFMGSGTFEERELTTKEKVALQNVLRVYELSGELG